MNKTPNNEDIQSKFFILYDVPSKREKLFRECFDFQL